MNPRPDINAPRRGLSRKEAAQYVGICVNTFDGLVAGGKMPKPIAIGRRRVWDIRKLDTAFEQLETVEIDEGEWA